MGGENLPMVGLLKSWFRAGPIAGLRGDGFRPADRSMAGSDGRVLGQRRQTTPSAATRSISGDSQCERGSGVRIGNPISPQTPTVSVVYGGRWSGNRTRYFPVTSQRISLEFSHARILHAPPSHCARQVSQDEPPHPRGETPAGQL